MSPRAAPVAITVPVTSLWLAATTGLALVLMTVRGRVDRARPVVAASQRLVTVTVMATGAALGDILPGT
jgi:hypothetical protein